MIKPRILLVMHALTRTGAPMVALQVFKALRGEIDARVVTREGGPLGQSFQDLYPLSVLRPSVPAGGAIGRSRALVYGARPEAWAPDVVYVNSTAALATWSRLRSVRRRGAPVLLHVHEGPIYMAGVESQFPGLIAGLPDHYICASNWVGRAVADEYGISQDRIVVIPSPVGDEWFTDDGSGVRTHERDGAFVVGGAGVPSWTKGTDLWLLTAAELVRRPGGRGRYRFVWVGSRDDEGTRQMRATIAKLGLADLVTLVPHQADVRPVFDSMDVFFMSSWEELAGVVALEAMALGRPVVCFAGSGGPPEVVGDTGLVVEAFSPTAAAHAVEGLASDEAGRTRLGDAARRRARAHFSVGAVAQQVLAEIVRRRNH